MGSVLNAFAEYDKVRYQPEQGSARLLHATEPEAHRRDPASPSDPRTLACL